MLGQDTGYYQEIAILTLNVYITNLYYKLYGKFEMTIF